MNYYTKKLNKEQHSFDNNIPHSSLLLPEVDRFTIWDSDATPALKTLQVLLFLVRFHDKLRCYGLLVLAYLAFH